MSDYKHETGAQKRKEKKERISQIRKTTHKIDTFFVKKATSSEQIKDAADFGIQDTALTAAEAPSEFEIAHYSAEPLDLSYPDKTEFDGSLAEVSRSDSDNQYTDYTCKKCVFS